MTDFKNKLIWITGASSGIGEALVHGFDDFEAKVIISSRSEKELDRVKSECTHPENIMIIPLDLIQHDTIKNKVTEVINKFGEIDILINNGGISQRSLVKDTSLEVDKRIMDVNFFGTIALTKAILPYMLKRKNGHIVVMSSLTGKFGTPLRSAYAASKHALHGFFDSLRAEVWQDNIFVTIVTPGFVRTNVSINALTADGSPQQTMDVATNNGMDPKVLAHKIIKAIQKNKEEVIISGHEKIGIYLKRFLPKLFSNIIKKAKVS